MVFCNKLLRSYVLIELKTTPLTPAAVGQVNAYLNYYAEEGTYDELVDKGGLFAELVERQRLDT